MSLLNATFVPSGEIDGWAKTLNGLKHPQLLAVLFVRFLMFEPSESISQMSKLPSRLLTNAIVDPSCDHAGDVSREFPPARMWRFEPSAFAPYTSKLPLGQQPARAILEPSGDQAGSKLNGVISAASNF